MNGISRRSLMAAMGAMAVAGPALAAKGDGGLASASALGGWIEDGRGLPAYRFTAGLPVKTLDAGGQPYPLDPDPFFILGNYRLTVFPKASGLYRLVSGERGWTRLNEPFGEAAQNAARLEITRGGQTRSHDLVGLDGVCADAIRARRDFGCGYARYALTPEDGIAVVRTLSVKPSGDSGMGDTEMGDPAMAIVVTVTNTGRSACDFRYTESVLSHVALGIELGQPEGARTVRFVNRIDSDAARGLVVSHATAQSDEPGVLRGRGDANRYNLFPASLALIGRGAVPGSRALSPGAAWLDTTVTGRLKAGESRTMTFVVGLCPDQDTAALQAFSAGLGAGEDGVHFGGEWQAALVKFRTLADPVLRRELTWNSHALLAMATYNSFYGETFIPQGMTYDYQMDLTAAPRDHLQHAMAAACFRPALAKSTIRYVLSKMTVDGEIKYTDFGFGMTSNSAWNTSDQQLYLFQGVGEYLRLTGDHAFLDEATHYLPHQAGLKGTVLEKLERAMTYLREEVSTGPHGLVRLMNSDWSDMVFADRSVLRYFWTAESHMNSAMVLAVVPELKRQVAAYGGAQAETAKRLGSSLQRYHDRIEKAFYADLGTRTFSRRLYFDGATPFGDDNMHIEPQSLLLQAASFPVERKRVLWAEVQARILKGEVVGPRQRQTPVTGGLVDPFVSENGGFWFSLAGQMISGLSTFDRDAGLAMLRMMTFDNFAKHYPGYWTGLWSGPDTINAVPSGAIAGLPRPDNGGTWTTFASYCAHAHAWPIYAWTRLSEG
ncbi:GH36-type glycosyl hydrolase domain-containing protein [Asticcacaulis solisilvae]|uniref:GH36-type glycosyl hydrolase domain-containing protein n=1 Tax=Asticcacaulis solisilvae TaxID=1217274 RepID=UPI003FD8F8C8